MPEFDVAVVGAGPNGLGCAVRLAQRGLKVVLYEARSTVGGGTRSSNVLGPGLISDTCSAAHPFAVSSPFLRSLPLHRHGLSWLESDVVLAHPLDDGTAGALYRDIGRTAVGLGLDATPYRKAFDPLVASFDALSHAILGPALWAAKRPSRSLVGFGLRALGSAQGFVKRFGTPKARALFAGSAAHAFRPLTAPPTAAVGVMFCTAAHAVGWPVAKGGSQSLADALAGYFEELGGKLLCDSPIASVGDIDAGTVVFDLSPPAVAELVGDSLPARRTRALRRHRFGPGVFKLDLAVRGDIPWSASECTKATTVHLGGTFEQIRDSEAQVCAGVAPENPFVLLCQQYLADPGRSADGVNPVWAYAHVPANFEGDATEAVIGQIERFAPGFRQRIVGSHSTTPAQFEAYNPNYVGGDIAGGLNSAFQVAFRGGVSLNPYRLDRGRFYACSAATPPGAGTHAMGGFHAAEAVIADLC